MAIGYSNQTVKVCLRKHGRSSSDSQLTSNTSEGGHTRGVTMIMSLMKTEPD